jgi:hypothetical protein
VSKRYPRIFVAIAAFAVVGFSSAASAATNLAPADRAVVRTTYRPVLRWNLTPGESVTTVEIARSPAKTQDGFLQDLVAYPGSVEPTDILSPGATQWRPEVDLCAGTFYWHVASWMNASVFSPTWSFSIPYRATITHVLVFRGIPGHPEATNYLDTTVYAIHDSVDPLLSVDLYLHARRIGHRVVDLGTSDPTSCPPIRDDWAEVSWRLPFHIKVGTQFRLVVRLAGYDINGARHRATKKTFRLTVRK